ncbi:FHA domain-containing protein [Paraliomyxa miuraensis]|uniref:FHA domain-containing protein n=1 Tax=Paraliomyxa miuraensis TaxID=376150 RepID=UPI002253FFC3|nr:FHA domain-containing protein [Paraliomyxa miuraensis]MCX4246940.1 FHA domain-containing protein [Paraliomyxa miuraensis]
MPHVLRAISGSQVGALYVLGERTLVGRASDCDIQILHEGVSRHHARISCEADGSVVLVDLSSDNGTFVESERVERHVLEEGEVIRFMRARFVFENRDDDVVTSEVFQRKVTSGDSLRQTVPHKRELAAIRARITQGLDGMVGENLRAHSRPQAAAPAPSGARPGAASAAVPPERSTGVETRSRTKEYPALSAEDAIDPASIRRPTPTTPPRGDEPSATGQERWPQHPRHPSPTSHSSHPSREEASVIRDRRPRGTGGRGIDASSTQGLVGTYAEGRGRRDRITAMPTSWLQATGTASPTRSERSHGMAPDGPSGRMAPAAPAGVELGAADAVQPPAALGGGWVRVPRPLITPGGMRPGATAAGLPRVEPSHAPMLSPMLTPTSAGPGSIPPRKGITAEYGAIVDGPRLASCPAPDQGAEVDAMTTVPSVRRVDRSGGSGTPTEEVPAVHDPAPAPVAADDDDELDARTRPRITRAKRWTRHAPTAIAYEDTLRIQRDAAPEEGDGPAPEEGDAPVRARSSPSESIAVPGEPVPGGDREHRRREGLERLAEIVEYRELRARALLGRALGPTATERCAELERQLEQRPPGGDERAAMRRYHRFVCAVPALLVPPEGMVAGPAAVKIEDLSAGGARITHGDCSLVAGDVVSLSVELPEANAVALPESSARAIVLDARVVWSQPHEAALGLVFVGAPRYRAPSSG